MVLLNHGYPDPEKPPEDVSANNEIIVGTDPDTDEDENVYNEYELLPMNDVGEASDDDNSEDEVPPDNVLPLVVSMEESLVKEVWGSPAPKEVDIEMDSNKIDEVKKAMVNFTLPSSSIPEWAHNIPEEQWKQRLIDKLNDQKS